MHVHQFRYVVVIQHFLLLLPVLEHGAHIRRNLSLVYLASRHGFIDVSQRLGVLLDCLQIDCLLLRRRYIFDESRGGIIARSLLFIRQGTFVDL